MATINGVGTKLYGSTDRAEDGSFICTNWLVFLYLPIIPIESFRVARENTSHLVIYNARKYRTTNIPLHKKQVFTTYACAYGILATLLTLFNVLQAQG